jgi:hypothetical protein
VAAVAELVTGVLEEAGEFGLGLATPGVALAALVGVAIVGAPRTRPLAKGAIRGFLTARDFATGGAAAIKNRAGTSVESAKELADESAEAVKDQASGGLSSVVGVATGGYVAARHRAAGWVAEVREGFEDLYAEAKHEYTVERAAELDLVVPGETPAPAEQELVLPGTPEAEATLAQAAEGPASATEQQADETAEPPAPPTPRARRTRAAGDAGSEPSPA